MAWDFEVGEPNKWQIPTAHDNPSSKCESWLKKEAKDMSDLSPSNWKLFQGSERSQGDRSRSGAEVQEPGHAGVGCQFLLGAGHWRKAQGSDKQQTLAPRRPECEFQFLTVWPSVRYSILLSFLVKWGWYYLLSKVTVRFKWHEGPSLCPACKRFRKCCWPPNMFPFAHQLDRKLHMFMSPIQVSLLRVRRGWRTSAVVRHCHVWKGAVLPAAWASARLEPRYLEGSHVDQQATALPGHGSGTLAHICLGVRV